MSIDTWGDKPKSQEDDSTIDEEIDAKIDAHLADPDAHLDTGESLQSHKASEIIDHLAGSIVEDKIATGEISSRCITTDQIIAKDFRTAADVGATVDGVKYGVNGIEMWQDGEERVNIPVSGDPYFAGDMKVGSIEYSKFILNTYFESLDGYSKYLTGGRGSIACAVAEVIINGGGVTDDVAFLGVEPMSIHIDYTNDDPLFDMRVLLNEPSYSNMLLGCGVAYYYLPTNGFGFYWDVDDDKFYVFTSVSGTMYKTEITAPDFTDWHRYRAEKIGSAIYFYIDGVLVATITTNLPTYDDEFHVGVAFQANEDTEAQNKIGSLLFIKNSLD